MLIINVEHECSIYIFYYEISSSLVNNLMSYKLLIVRKWMFLKCDFLDTLYLYVCNCLEITDVCNECTGCLAKKSNGGTKLYPMC